MKKVFFTLTIILTAFYLSGQTPGIRWQHTLGGANYDGAAFSIKTIDNGFILVGQTFSNDGSFSTNHGGGDLWVEKFNVQGTSQWRKILGGSNLETPVSYYHNVDGTTVILSTTNSLNGDITNNHGAIDIWLCKLDNNGTVLWQKCFGGSANEYVSNITKSIDGNYIISGATSSTNGDVTANNGVVDAWVFKVSETGVLVWQKNLGGGGQEGFEFAKSVEGSDGSIYLLTETGSTNGDVTGNHGASNTRDLWLVKLNSAGVLQWQNCYGGSHIELCSDIKLSPTGEIYIAGYARSVGLPSFHGINTDYSDFYICRVSQAGVLLFEKCFGGTLDDEPNQIVSIEADGSLVIGGYVNNGGGDVVGYHGVATGSDIWTLKINLSGTIVWQKTLGGFGRDRIVGIASDSRLAIGGIIKTLDNGYLITAFTECNDGDITGFHNPTVFDSSFADLWVVKLSSAGLLEWQRPLGGFRGELPQGAPLEIGDNDFIITGSTNSLPGGDITNNNGNWDAWIIRLSSVNTVTGVLYYDENSNGVKDIGEPFFSNAIVKTEKPGDTRISVPVNGLFKNETDIGDYTTTVQLPLTYYNVVPSSHLSSFTTYFNKDSFSFAIQPIPGVKDLVINAIPLSVARPGFNVSYKILYKNIGTDPVPVGEILFKKDSRLNFISSVPAITSSNGDTLKWSYSNLDPLDSTSITVNFQVQIPPLVNLGDTLTSIGIITPVAGDQTPLDDTVVIKQIVVGSFDPNDKYEKNEGRVPLTYVSDGKYLDYLVRFQNLGTDTAFNIVVLDTLSEKLDLSTLQVIATSHSYKVTLTGNILTWTFNNIKLPHSAINEPASHGYIAYRIVPLNSVALGDTIHNTASIYFDFNLPVQTNNAFTTIGDDVALPLKLISFSGVYHNEKAVLQWTTTEEFNIEKFEIQRSFNGTDFIPIGYVSPRGGFGVTTPYEFTDNLQNVSTTTFFYRLLISDKDGKISYSRVLLFRKATNAVNSISINPNPVTGVALVNINYSSKAIAEFRVVDMNGKIVLRQRNSILQGSNSIAIKGMENLLPGFYVLHANTNDHKLAVPFVVK